MPQRVLLLTATALAIHGLVLAIFAFLIEPTLRNGSYETLETSALWILYFPAMFLAKPLNSILWDINLINSPGWFSWPRPIGFVVVYGFWIGAILIIRFVLGRITPRRLPGVK